MGKPMIVYSNAATINEWLTTFQSLFQALLIVSIYKMCICTMYNCTYQGFCYKIN